MIGLARLVTGAGGGHGPSLNFNFVDGSAFSPQITFTRASTATYFDATGTLQSAAIDTPRFDYDPATLAARGFLIEEQRTNLVLQSQDFANSAGPVLWVWPAAFVTGNTEVAPDGTTTADTVTSSGGVQSIYQSVTVTASTAYTFSVFVKLGTMPAADYKIAFYDNIAATFIAADIVPTQVPNTSSWTRISYTFTTPVGCTSVRVYPFRNSATIPSSTVFLWGAQLETGAFPTSYIPTTTTALTRSADVASVNTLSPWFNSTAGTICADFSVSYDVAANTFPLTVSFDDNTTPNRIVATSRTIDDRTAFSVVSGGVSQASLLSNNTITYGVAAKCASAYAVGDAATALNGVLGTLGTPAVIPSGMSYMRLGNAITGGVSYNSILNGYLRRVTYYPRRLSNAELQGLTA